MVTCDTVNDKSLAWPAIGIYFRLSRRRYVPPPRPGLWQICAEAPTITTSWKSPKIIWTKSKLFCKSCNYHDLQAFWTKWTICKQVFWSKNQRLTPDCYRTYIFWTKWTRDFRTQDLGKHVPPLPLYTPLYIGVFYAFKKSFSLLCFPRRWTCF